MHHFYALEFLKNVWRSQWHYIIACVLIDGFLIYKGMNRAAFIFLFAMYIFQQMHILMANILADSTLARVKTMDKNETRDDENE